MQWNAQSIHHNKYFFKQFLNNNNIQIALISETWLKQNINFQIRGYTIVRNDCGNNHNGVAIVIHNSLNFQHISTFFDISLQNIMVKVQIYNKFINILSFYCPPSVRFNKTKFNNLIKNISGPVIVAGDFNAHHTVWGCSSVDSRARDIIDVMEENDLVLLNDGSPTTIGSNLWRPNGLDLTMVSSSLVLSCEWQVVDSPLGGSYHLPTVTKYNFSPVDYIPSTSNIPRHINPKLIDWALYKEYANELLSDFIVDSSDPIDSYNRFCLIIHTAIEKSVFRRGSTNCHTLSNHENCHGRGKKKILPLPWWNVKCSKAVESCKQAFLSFKLSPTLDNYIAFKRAQAIKKVIIRNECRAGWTEFCSSINRLVPMKIVWDKMRKFNRSWYW